MTIKYFREDALDLLEQGKWASAAISLSLWETSAREFAGLVASAARPLGKTTTGKSMGSLAQLRLIEQYQKLSSKYQEEANMAIVLQAECYWNMGDYDRTLETIISVFDSLTREEWETWTKAREILSDVLDLGIE